MVHVIPERNLEVTTNERYAFSTDELEQWLQEYDSDREGWYRESPFEGYAVWVFIMKKIAAKDLPDKAPESWFHPNLKSHA